MAWRFNPIKALRNLFIGSSDTTETPTVARIDPDAPAPVETGTDSYYRERHADFVKRNPGVEPPDYYLEFGDKYMKRFMTLDTAHLSPEALAWRDRTRTALQDAMENKCREDPATFAMLERDAEAFKSFAYDTHADAYVKSGLFDLSAQDIAIIATTPDVGDILTSDGLKGWLDTVLQLRPHDIYDIGKATVADVLD